MEENNFRERIIENLKEHPEGLTILNIAENTGINRITVSKYIFGMVSGGLIFQRKVGPAKLCYLKRNIKRNKI
ncbi:MAG: winged helix-turn-helix transcriptional regulator [Candidatus Aenigmarchaeota archaeon]|nr:winged helix-turn-helix transcriptional regulator [Candidatus Aenigmarchaeota archaeon]